MQCQCPGQFKNFTFLLLLTCPEEFFFSSYFFLLSFPSCQCSIEIHVSTTSYSTKEIERPQDTVYARHDAILQDKSHIAVTENSKKKHNAIYCSSSCCSNVHVCPFLMTINCAFLPGISFSPSDHMLVKNYFPFSASEKENK